MTPPTITRNRAGSVVLQFPYDAALIASLKAAIPAHARRYDPIAKSWTVSAAYADVAARLMVAVFPDVDLVDQSRTGPPSDRAPHAGDPYAVLHLRPSAPPELVTAAHRVLARIHHPDVGGSTAAMQAINAAADAIGTRRPP